MLLAVSIFSFMIDNTYLLLFLLNIMLIFVIISRVDLKKMFRYVKPTLWLIPTIFIIQFLAWESLSGNFINIPVNFGFASAIVSSNRIISISVDALILAANSCLRILNLAVGSSLFSLTTNSNDYLQSLTKIGFPFEIAFTTGLVIYFLPFRFWAGVLSIKCASYMRGLHAHTSNILLILAYYPISFHQLLCSFSPNKQGRTTEVVG